MLSAMQDPLSDIRVFNLSAQDTQTEIRRIISEEEIVFIVGSAVSIFTPTRMPNGLKVTENISKHLSEGSSDREFIEHEIQRAAFETIFQSHPNRSDIEKLFIELYDRDKPNSIHAHIANAPRQKPYDIITPNYDRCLELSSISWHPIVRENDFMSRPQFKRLFKIHGTIEAPETLVFTINAEAPLSGWKRDLFFEMTDRKVIIIVGYSGLDFEICPAIASSNATSILWNMRPKDGKLDFSSPNAENIFNIDKRCKILLGDMRDLFGDKSDIETSESDGAIKRFFESMSKSTLMTWKIRLLDTLGLCRQAKEVLKLSKEYVEPRVAKQSEIAVAYRSGRYFDSAKLCFEEARTFYSGNQAELYGASGAAFRFRNYGSHRKARNAYRVSLRAWLRSNRADRDSARLNLLWLGTLIRLRDKSRLSRTLRLAKRMAILSLKQGHWGQYYLVKPLLDRHEINIASAVGINVPLLPAQQGFLHIGNLSSRIDDFTAGMPNLSPEKELIDLHISDAQRAGLYPNAWKCAYAGMLFGQEKSLRRRLSLVIQFFKALHKCQYSTFMKLRIQILGIGAFFGMHKKILS